MKQNFLDLLPQELRNIINDSYDIVLERAIGRAYKNLAEEEKSKMALVFAKGTDKEKEEFLKKYLQDFPQLFLEEAKRFTAEIKK